MDRHNVHPDHWSFFCITCIAKICGVNSSYIFKSWRRVYVSPLIPSITHSFVFFAFMYWLIPTHLICLSFCYCFFGKRNPFHPIKNSFGAFIFFTYFPKLIYPFKMPPFKNLFRSLQIFQIKFQFCQTNRVKDWGWIPYTPCVFFIVGKFTAFFKVLMRSIQKSIQFYPYFFFCFGLITLTVFIEWGSPGFKSWNVCTYQSAFCSTSWMFCNCF